jgi:hypothetical protein
MTLGRSLWYISSVRQQIMPPMFTRGSFFAEQVMPSAQSIVAFRISARLMSLQVVSLILMK